MEEKNEERNSYLKKDTVMIILLVISLAFNISNAAAIGNIRNDISNIQSNTAGIFDSIRTSVDNAVSSIRQAVEKDMSMVSDFKYEMGKVNSKQGTVPLRMSVSLKSIGSGDKVFLRCIYDDATERIIEAKSSNGLEYTAFTYMSAAGSAALSLVIENGENKRKEELGSVSGPAKQMAESMQIGMNGGETSYSGGKLILLRSYELTSMNPDISLDRLHDVKLEVVLNEEVVRSVEFVDDAYSQGSQLTCNLEKYILECGSGDVVDIRVKAKDKLGFKYAGTIERMKCKDEGSAENVDVNMVMHVVAE